MRMLYITRSILNFYFVVSQIEAQISSKTGVVLFFNGEEFMHRTPKGLFMFHGREVSLLASIRTITPLKESPFSAVIIFETITFRELKYNNFEYNYYTDAD